MTIRGSMVRMTWMASSVLRALFRSSGASDLSSLVYGVDGGSSYGDVGRKLGELCALYGSWDWKPVRAACGSEDQRSVVSMFYEAEICKADLPRCRTMLPNTVCLNCWL